MQQDMGMFTESASIKAGSVDRVDRSTPWDKPGEWRERRLGHLQGALRLIEREIQMSDSNIEIELQVELAALKKKIALLQDRIATVRKQSFSADIQNKDLSAQPDATFAAPVDPMKDIR